MVMYLLYDLFCLTRHDLICQILNAMTWKDSLQLINVCNLSLEEVFIVLIIKMSRKSGYMYNTLTCFEGITYVLPLICKPLSDGLCSSQGCHMLMGKHVLRHVTAFEHEVSAMPPVQNHEETLEDILYELECLYGTLLVT